METGTETVDGLQVEIDCNCYICQSCLGAVSHCPHFGSLMISWSKCLLCLCKCIHRRRFKAPSKGKGSQRHCRAAVVGRNIITRVKNAFTESLQLTWRLLGVHMHTCLRRRLLSCATLAGDSGRHWAMNVEHWLRRGKRSYILILHWYG